MNRRIALTTSCCRAALALAALVSISGALRAQWSSNPAANLGVCTHSGDQAVPKLAATGDGKTWMGWFDNTSGSYAVYVQLLDVDGTELLPHDGLLVSNQPQSTSLVDWDLISDAQGSAVLAFTDTRAGGDLDVYAYRIDQAGQFLWGANGVTLSANADFEANPRLAATSDGNLVCVWSRLPSGSDGSVRMQKLDASGAAQYPANGLGITGAAGEDPGFASVVPADNGGYVVSWLRDIGTFASPRTIRAQKFDPAGQPLWGASPVDVYDQTSVPIAHDPILQSDGAGGALFCWHRSLNNVFDCLVQHVSSAGAEVFPHNGVLVSADAGIHELDPSLAWLPASGDMVVCFGKRNLNQSQWGVGAQRISATGQALWGPNGVALQPIDGVEKEFQRCLPFGNGALVFWFDNPTMQVLQSRVVAMRLDANGASTWGAQPTVMSSLLSAKDDLEVGIDASGMARALWHDERTDSGDMYAQNVNPDGTLGVPTTCTTFNYCTGAANSAGPGATIGSSGSTSIALNDLVLTAAGCPANKSGLFFYGPNQINGAPFYNGFLCTSGGFYRLHTTTTTASGSASSQLDVTQPPSPGGQILAGSNWSFQFWYRDPSQGVGANLSDALRANFCP